MRKHIHVYLSQISVYRSNKKLISLLQAPRCRLQTPAKSRLRQTPPYAPSQPRLQVLSPETQPSENNFGFPRITQTVHSTTQA